MGGQVKMSVFELLIYKFGRQKKSFLSDYVLICKLFSIPNITGWSKNGVWIYIPAEEKGEGLHSIQYAQTESELEDKLK